MSLFNKQFPENAAVFLGMLRINPFKELIESLDGYDLSITGEAVYSEK